MACEPPREGPNQGAERAPLIYGWPGHGPRRAGLLVLVPGSDETLRIDGPATITTDPAILGLWSDQLRTPKVAVIVETEAALMHDPSRRSGRRMATDPGRTSIVPTVGPGER